MVTITYYCRGLLLPKIVVDDFGRSRSDPGMLGAGIYFAASARYVHTYSTCIYTTLCVYLESCLCTYLYVHTYVHVHARITSQDYCILQCSVVCGIQHLMLVLRCKYLLNILHYCERAVFSNINFTSFSSVFRASFLRLDTVGVVRDCCW